MAKVVCNLRIMNIGTFGTTGLKNDFIACLLNCYLTECNTVKLILLKQWLAKF